MRLAFALMPFALLIGCATTINLIDEEIAQQIPKEARKVLLSHHIPADSLYRMLFATAIHEGYAIKSSNNKMRTFTTEPKDVGGDTFLRMTAIVETKEDSALATITGQWQFGSTTQAMQRALVGYSTDPTWEDAYWAGSGTKYRMAFAAIVKFAEQIPNARIEYK